MCEAVVKQHSKQRTMAGRTRNPNNSAGLRRQCGPLVAGLKSGHGPYHTAPRGPCPLVNGVAFTRQPPSRRQCPTAHRLPSPLQFATTYEAPLPRNSHREIPFLFPSAHRTTALTMATELTAAELRAYDGSDPSKPIYLAVRGKVYDVTSGRSFYGPGGSYAMFAGREAARALGKMSKDEADISGDLSGLSEKELGVLADWETKFQAKYPVVGRLVDA